VFDNGCLGHAGGTRALVNLSGRKMSAFVQGLQNGQTLGGHTIAARPQGLGMFGNAGQGELLGLNPEKLWKNRIWVCPASPDTPKCELLLNFRRGPYCKYYQ